MIPYFYLTVQKIGNNDYTSEEKNYDSIRRIIIRILQPGTEDEGFTGLTYEPSEIERDRIEKLENERKGSIRKFKEWISEK